MLYDQDDSDTDEECSLDIDALQDVWNDFVCLMESLTVLPTSDRYLDPDKFQESAKKWAQRFRKCTFDEDVIPYIHGNLSLQHLACSAVYQQQHYI